MKKQRRKSRKPTVGQQLVEALREVAEAVESEESLEARFTARTVEITDPGEYTPRQIRFLRQRIGASQAVFAQLVGVSTELIQHWEQGLAEPRPIARRLLDEISRDPSAYFRRMTQRTRLSA